MTLDELFTKYKVEDGDKDIVHGLIETEKQKGIEASRKKGEEVKKHLTDANHLRDTIKALGVDPDGDLETQISDIKGKLTGKAGKETELEKTVKTLQTRLDKKDKEAAEKETKYRNLRVSERLVKAIGDKVHASEYVIKNLIQDGKVSLNDNDEVIWKDAAGDLDFEKGVDSFIKSNPSIVKNQQAAGSGSTGGTGKPPGKTMPKDAWLNMPAKERAKFINDGGQYTD
jgi:hypothetical protein